MTDQATMDLIAGITSTNREVVEAIGRLTEIVGDLVARVEKLEETVADQD